METITLNTYTGSFEAPKKWLENNIEEMTLNDFLGSYTWDEGEWLYIMYSTEQEKKEVAHLTKQLKQGYSLFIKGDQEGVLHDSSKGGQYQFSYFDTHGAVGDIQKDSLKEMAKSIYEYGFRLCSKEELSIVK